MTIVTKKGDDGKTTLANKETVSKADARVKTYGKLDELVCFLGLARSLSKDKEISVSVKDIQHDLFTLGGELAMSHKVKIGDQHLKNVEELILKYEPTIKVSGFTVPGDSTPSAAMDVARAICRHLERKIVSLKEAGKFSNDVALKYINRLSDLLYIFARMS